MYLLQVIGLGVRRYTGKAFAGVVAVVAFGSLALFLARAWMPFAASAHAPMLDRQLHWTLIDAGVIFLISQLALAAFVWRFRDREKKTKTMPHGIATAVIVSVVFIALELFSAATLGRKAWASMYESATPADAVSVEAMGQQFAFYFRYPGSDGKFGPIHVEKIDPSTGNYFGLDRTRDSESKDDVVSAELVLPVNRPVDLVLDAQDVIHGFYVRELRIQQDMVPGMRIPVHFTPTKIGRYEIACTQLCGLGHYRMRAFLNVISQPDFQKWMQSHR
jgi:cytochrome c oxidase subunit II